MSFKEPIKRHICESCGVYLNKSEICEDDACLQNNAKCYEFSDLNVERQIQELFKDDDVCEHVLGQPGPTMPTSQYCDIKDGLEYRRLQQLSPREKICTFTMNTGKGSLWPIYMALNELPVKLRYSKKFLLTTHLYCHHEKPDMLAYLVPLMETLKKLQSEGIMVYTPRGAFLLKFRLLAVALDLPAKAMVLNAKQFNGKFGCSYCLDEGSNPPNKLMMRYYPFHESFVLRSHQATVNDAYQAVLAGEAVNGIKGASALIALDYFDLTKDVVIDWMHNVLLGVVKTLLSMWFDSAYRRNDFYIGDKIALANRRLTKIQVPDYVTRQQKEINNHARWKASECREWLFHYSVPVLTGILAPELIIHYSLLVTGVFILNKEYVTDDEIAFAEGCLHDFCKLFPQYYVEEKQTMNLHLLQHLARCVRLHGPLFNYSCFGFESMNNHIKKMVHGTRFVNNQICFAVSMARCLPDLVKGILAKANDDMKHLIQRLNNNALDERMVVKMLGLKKKYCPTPLRKSFATRAT